MRLSGQKCFETSTGLDKLFGKGEAVLEKVSWRARMIFDMDMRVDEILVDVRRKVTAFRCISMTTESNERYP